MGDVPTAWKAHTGEAINLPYEGGLMLKIVGYPDRYSVPQGGEIRFMVSLEEGELAARLVRVVNGDCNRTARASSSARLPIPPTRPIGASARPSMPAPTWSPRRCRPQRIYIHRLDLADLAAARFQVIAAQGPLRIGIDHGALTLAALNERHALAALMLVRQWYAIKVSLDARTRRFMLEQKPAGPIR